MTLNLTTNQPARQILTEQEQLSIKKKLTKLEAIRGFAAVYTVCHHTFSHAVNNTLYKILIIGGKDLSFIFRFGQEAVMIFFLLSGFVINYAFMLSKDRSFKTFFLKRFLRIYIPLICVFIVNYAVLCIQADKWVTINIGRFFGNLFMLQDTTSAFKANIVCGPFLGNAPLWSLSYEWWFYMLFFLIVTKVKTNRSMLVYGVSIVAALSYLILPNFINRELMYLALWWAGACMADLYINDKPINFSNMKTTFVSLAICVAILAVNAKLHAGKHSIGESPFIEVRHFSFVMIAIALAILWSKIKWVGFDKTIGLFEFIAPISFGIYLSHWFLISTATYLDHIIANIYLRFIAYSACCVLFCYLVERVVYLKLNKFVLGKIKR